MDQIARQLRAEIESLEDHIREASDRFLATQWAGELLGPLQQLEHEMSPEELRAAVGALHLARTRFQVNGHLAQHIDAILERHDDLVTQTAAPAGSDGYREAVPELPDEATHDVDGLFEDEEDEQASPGPVDFGDDEIPHPAAGATFGDVPDTIPPSPPALFGSEDDSGGAEQITPFSDRAIPVPNQRQDPAGSDEDLGATTPVDAPTGAEPERCIDLDAGNGRDPLAPATDQAPEPEGGLPAGTSYAGTDDLFSEEPPGGDGRPDDAAGAAIDTLPELFDGQPRPTQAATSNHHRKKGARRPQTRPRCEDRTEQEEPYRIFGDKVSLDDLQAALDISVPASDLRALEHQLRARLADRVVAALRSSQIATGQYILLPRIPRFIDNGTTVPCTVKNLARRFHQRFGNLRDLARYRNLSMMTAQTPEPGWALITAESPRESLGKSYMEQNQYLRYLATSLGIPSHLLRRRTMVEAIYDIIVGQMVLGKTWQRQSLDWTASSPSKNDFVCVYCAPEGIRVRDLSRTTHHGSLGVCPNW